MVATGLRDDLLVQGLHFVHEAVARREGDVPGKVVLVLSCGPVELHLLDTGSGVLEPHLVNPRGLGVQPIALRASMLDVGGKIEASGSLTP